MSVCVCSSMPHPSCLHLARRRGTLPVLLAPVPVCAALTSFLLCHRNGQPRQAGAKALPNGAIISEKDLENAMPAKDVSGSDSPTSSDGHKTGNPTLKVSLPAGLNLWVAVTHHSSA